MLRRSQTARVLFPRRLSDRHEALIAVDDLRREWASTRPPPRLGGMTPSVSPEALRLCQSNAPIQVPPDFSLILADLLECE